MAEMDFSDTSRVQKSLNLKRIAIIILFAVLATLFAISVFRFVYLSDERDEPMPTPAPVVDESNQVLHDEEEVPERGNLSITIHNGSGEAGVAGDAADFLKSLGYTVSVTGNADNFDYEGVSIRLKQEEERFLNLLENDLSEKYEVVSKETDLPDSFSTDALVIIGK